MSIPSKAPAYRSALRKSSVSGEQSEARAATLVAESESEMRVLAMTLIPVPEMGNLTGLSAPVKVDPASDWTKRFRHLPSRRLNKAMALLLNACHDMQREDTIMGYLSKSGISYSRASTNTFDTSAPASAAISDWLWFLLAVVAVAAVVLL